VQKTVVPNAPAASASHAKTVSRGLLCMSVEEERRQQERTASAGLSIPFLK